jgi:hypothetical protein
MSPSEGYEVMEGLFRGRKSRAMFRALRQRERKKKAVQVILRVVRGKLERNRFAEAVEAKRVSGAARVLQVQYTLHCDPCRKKYSRGLLPSDRTCRRTQQRVYNAAENIGFASFPVEQGGNIWCWGDENGGNFTKGMNRYVYEVYHKTAINASATESNPWIILLTGDLARVSLRGKGITMCGVKEADPRLPSQLLTGKTMNQSKNLYTSAVAGYTDENK